jgi:Peptidase_C39 like family
MGNATWKSLALLLIAALLALLLLLYNCYQSNPSPTGVGAGGASLGTCTPGTAIGQKKNRWCWAASMQMVFKFHCIDIEQCNLAHMFINLEDPTQQPDPSFCNNYCLIDEIEGIAGNLPLQTFDGTNPQYFDILFSNNGFNSIEDNKDMSWNEVKRQINNCRPYIIDLKRNMKNDKGELINNIHAVVVVNYLETTSQNYVMIYDPWRPCIGCIELLPYPYQVWIETAENAGYEKGIVSTVHDIHSRSDTLCSSCNETKIPSIDKAIALDRNMISSLNNASLRLLDSLRTNPINTITPVRKISYNKIRKATDLGTLDKVTESRNLYQITTNQDKNVKYLVRERNNRLEIEEITYCDYYETEPTVAVNITGQIQNLKLSNGSNNNAIKYEFVDYEYLFYGFYRFTLNNIVYLSPIETYTNFYGQNEGIKQGAAYKESDLLPVLQNKTLMDYKNINGLIDGKGKFNKEK